MVLAVVANDNLYPYNTQFIPDYIYGSLVSQNISFGYISCSIFFVGNREANFSKTALNSLSKIIFHLCSSWQFARSLFCIVKSRLSANTIIQFYTISRSAFRDHCGNGSVFRIIAQIVADFLYTSCRRTGEIILCQRFVLQH